MDVDNVSITTTVNDIPVPVDIPPTHPLAMGSFGRTVIRPLGDLVYARSGDKGANVNVGFYCAEGEMAARKWDWLRSMLTTEKLRGKSNLHKEEISS